MSAGLFDAVPGDGAAPVPSHVPRDKPGMVAPKCEACEAWSMGPTGLFMANCDDCAARALAMSPAAWRALRGETDTEIREAIRRVFGEDHYARGRKLVWAWINRIKARREGGDAVRGD